MSVQTIAETASPVHSPSAPGAPQMESVAAGPLADTAAETAADQHTAAPLCVACGRLPQKTRKLCLSCLAADAMVWRNLGQWPDTFTNADKEAFLREASLKRLEDPRLQWKNLRTMLVERMVRTRIHQHRQSFGGKFLPESCWEKKGFTKDHIHRSAKEWSDGLQDWTYQVCIKEIQEVQVREECAQYVMEREMEVRNRRNKKQGKRDAPEAFDLPDVEEAAAGPRDDGQKRTKRGEKDIAKEEARQARAKAAAAKKAAREEESAQQKTRQLLALATKHMQAAESWVKKLDNVLGSAQGVLDAGVCQNSLHYKACETAAEKLRRYLHEAKDIVQKAGRGETVKEDALQKENLDQLKAAGPALRGLQGEIDLVKPPRPAAKKKARKTAAPNEAEEDCPTQAYP